ncbi:MAG: hypothetical protein R3F33_06580 [Planctomycetota bacterium]
MSPLALLLCAHLLGTQAKPLAAQATGPAQSQASAAPMQEPGAAAQAPTTDAREAALRTPMRDLPRAEPGTWSDFDESTPPPPLYRTAMLAWQADDLLLTIAHCQALLRERPDYPPALLLCANAQYGLQRYGEGLDAFERLLAHLPSALPRTRQMGHCLHSLGRNPEAEIHYTRILAAAPDDWRTLRSRAVVRFHQQKLADAAADLQAVLATHPADPDTLYWHARLLFEQESEAALPAAHAARDAEPLRARTWFLVAQAELEAAHPDRAETARARHAELSRVETSLRDLERQHRRHADNPAPLETMARITLALGDLPAAAEHYRRLIPLAHRIGNPDLASRATRSLEAITRARGQGR